VRAIDYDDLDSVSGEFCNFGLKDDSPGSAEAAARSPAAIPIRSRLEEEGGGRAAPVIEEQGKGRRSAPPRLPLLPSAPSNGAELLDVCGHIGSGIGGRAGDGFIAPPPPFRPTLHGSRGRGRGGRAFAPLPGPAGPGVFAPERSVVAMQSGLGFRPPAAPYALAPVAPRHHGAPGEPIAPTPIPYNLKAEMWLHYHNIDKEKRERYMNIMDPLWRLNELFNNYMALEFSQVKARKYLIRMHPRRWACSCELEALEGQSLAFGVGSNQKDAQRKAYQAVFDWLSSDDIPREDNPEQMQNKKVLKIAKYQRRNTRAHAAAESKSNLLAPATLVNPPPFLPAQPAAGAAASVPPIAGAAHLQKGVSAPPPPPVPRAAFHYPPRENERAAQGAGPQRGLSSSLMMDPYRASGRQVAQQYQYQHLREHPLSHQLDQRGLRWRSPHLFPVQNEPVVVVHRHIVEHIHRDERKPAGDEKQQRINRDDLSSLS